MERRVCVGSEPKRRVDSWKNLFLKKVFIPQNLQRTRKAFEGFSTDQSFFRSCEPLDRTTGKSLEGFNPGSWFSTANLDNSQYLLMSGEKTTTTTLLPNHWIGKASQIYLWPMKAQLHSVLTLSQTPNFFLPFHFFVVSQLKRWKGRVEKSWKSFLFPPLKTH